MRRASKVGIDVPVPRLDLGGGGECLTADGLAAWQAARRERYLRRTYAALHLLS
jgi:hypothetical protein